MQDAEQTDLIGPLKKVTADEGEPVRFFNHALADLKMCMRKMNTRRYNEQHAIPIYMLAETITRAL